MGGKTKQSQRTKNNVRPSSSGRSAEILSNTINVDTSFVKVGSGKIVPAIFPTLTTPNIDQNLSSEYSICFKKFNKKDPITKTKALQELTELIKNGNVEEAVAALPSWAHYYQILVFDPDRRVRESLQTCHGLIVSVCGRQCAPHLRKLVPAWLIAQYDEHAPVASLAKGQLESTFPDNKLQEALLFCKNEILTLLIDNLTGSPEDMLINKYLDAEERAQATIRIQTESLRALDYFVTKLPESQVNWVWEVLAPLLEGNGFWKMAAHTSHNVRAAWYGTIGTLVSVLITRFPREVKTRILKALVALPERNASVATERWAAVLVFMHNVQDWSTLLDKKDLLVKRLLDVLESGGWGEARLLTNILLPLLDKLPEELLNKDFYLTFFNAMFTGLQNKNTLNSKSERQIWITSLSECLRYLSIQKYDYVLEIVTYVHRTWLEMVFLIKDNQTRCNLIKHSATNMAGIAKYWLKQTNTSNTLNAPNTPNFPQNDKYDQLIRNFWQNIGSTISLQIEKLPLEPNEITNLIDDHILLLKALKSTFNQEKKQLSIQFADEKVEKIETKSTDKTIYDKALIDRYRHNLNNLVETACCEYFDFAYKKSMSSAVFSSLITLLIEFDSDKLFLAVSKHFNADSLYSFYDKVLRNWLSGDTMRCKPLVEILFLMVKYFSEDEQDAMYNSFQQFPPALVEWCMQVSQWRAARGAGGAGGAKRWLRGALVGASVAALCARNDASARALLLACLAHGDDGEVMINESAVTKVIDTLCSQLSYTEDDKNKKNEQFLENNAALGAQVAAALANTSLQAKATPLLLKLFQLNLNVMHGTWSCPNSWSETRSAWRDALPGLTPEHRVAVVDSALELLHGYVYENTEELNMKRIEHASTLCPYLLISSETNTNKNIAEIITLTKKIFKLEPKTQVPLEIFALKIDCIFGNLNCPFEDDNDFIQKVVNDNEDTELDKTDLMLYVHKSVFRTFFLRAMLSRNECLDEEDGVSEHWREELLNDTYYKELISLVLYEYVVISTLCERYAFWPHYEVIRDAKQRIEKLIDDIISEISLDTKNMILSHISEVAAVNGYYWSFARSFFSLKINEKTQEKEQLNETSDSLKVDNEKTLLDNQNKSLESSRVDNEETSSPGENVEQNEDSKNSNVLENSSTNTVENDNKMKSSLDMSKLEEVVTGTGYFHSLQAESKFSSITPESTLCALMLRSIAAMGGTTGDALREELSGGSGALDAVINVYYKHNELMLYDRLVDKGQAYFSITEREVISALWVHITHNVYIVRYLRHCVETRGWDLPSHYWDFTTITLCSMVTSLRESVKQWGCVKAAMLSQAILELFESVRTFISDVPAQAQKQQPSDHVAALPNEWKDIFAPDLNVNLFEIITFVLNDHKKPMTLSRIAVIDSLLNIIPHLQWERIPAQRLTPLAEGVAEAALNALEGLAHHAYLFLAYAALDAVDKPLVLDDAEKLSAWGGNTEEQAPQLSLERLHTPLLNLYDLLDAALQDVVVCARTCETVPASDAARVALALLLAAAALLRHARLARADLHHYYVQVAREYEYANYMLPHVLRLLPAEVLHERALSPALLARFHAAPLLRVYEWCNHTTISTLACSLLTDILGGITGAGARSYAAALDSAASAVLKRVVKNAVSPILLKRQLTALRDRANELEDTQVAIQWSRAEVQLSLTVEDQTLYLCIQFSDDHPLTPPRVTTPQSLTSHASPSRGPLHGTDTQWIVMYLAYQNGSLLNASKMWVTALTTRVAAARVCYICYCRLLPAPRARLPAACHTCRNEFHAQCLRKWFATSYRSNCPVCRSKF